MGVHLNEKDYAGRTPLCLVAQVGDTETVEFLLQHGASINGMCKYGFTALHLAAEKGNERAAKLLLTCSADPNAKSRISQKPVCLTGGRVFSIGASSRHKYIFLPYYSTA